MISAKVSVDRDKRECSLTVKGHAGQADIGQDVVCASASILAFTAAQVLKTMYEGGEFMDHPTLDLDNGDATVSCCVDDDTTFMQVLQTFFTIAMGYRLLAHNYPQYVELTYDGEDI